MTDTANAPERIWTADTTGNCSVGFNTPSLEYKNEYISRTHCDELVAAAYLDAAQVLEDEIDLARIALPQAVPVLRADIRAIKNRTPTKAMAALTAYGERMKAEGASEAQAKIARLTEALKAEHAYWVKCADADWAEQDLHERLAEYPIVREMTEAMRKADALSAALQGNTKIINTTEGEVS